MSIICPLFSGSTGNSTYIGTKNGAILIDAGASMKRIMEAVENAGGSRDEIKAIAVTHQHNDHITGLKPVLNKLKIPLIASQKTAEALISGDKIPKDTKVIVIDEDGVDINGIFIKRFATSHDCEGSSGYNVLLPDQKIFTLCTDLGVVTDAVRESLYGSDLVLLESNHDVEMLKRGPYPPELKVRILSDKGHISNNSCAAELCGLLQKGTKRFILGHLSQNNNTPLLARSAAESALVDIGAENGKDYLLSVAKPTGNGVTVI